MKTFSLVLRRGPRRRVLAALVVLFMFVVWFRLPLFILLVNMHVLPPYFGQLKPLGESGGGLVIAVLVKDAESTIHRLLASIGELACAASSESRPRVDVWFVCGGSDDTAARVLSWAVKRPPCVEAWVTHRREDPTLSRFERLASARNRILDRMMSTSCKTLEPPEKVLCLRVDECVLCFQFGFLSRF